MADQPLRRSKTSVYVVFQISRGTDARTWIKRKYFGSNVISCHILIQESFSTHTQWTRYLMNKKEGALEKKTVAKITDLYHFVTCIFMHLYLADTAAQQIQQFCEQKIMDGVKFNHRGAVLVLLVPTRGARRTIVNNQQDSYFCTEFVVSALQSVGILSNHLSHHMTPGVLMTTLMCQDITHVPEKCYTLTDLTPKKSMPH